MLIAGKRASNERGFTYVMVLVAVVVIGLTVGTASRVTSHATQADREAELLFRGLAYRAAIKSYYETKGAAKFPRALEDLVNDPRHANKHHLRALYRDPFGDEWTLIRAADGGIAGVASASNKEPIKRANFPKGLESFNAANAYASWRFEHIPKLTIAQPPKTAAKPKP